ncbi:condensation domain-containing protein [Nocardia arizonensis]|uniref:condensation domain-containing protein n=1 Tax=Nocardia arizonensis TaxID=1141647 RepID=UPI0006D28D86|nr:condensation domain-containing protein [Nocardia arizonensis]
MIGFGFFDEWHPEAGRLIAWSATSRCRAAAAPAAAHPVPPSHQQEEYLRAAFRNAGRNGRGSRLCMMAFDLPGAPDHAAMTGAVNTFLRRHDTFSSWFAVGADEQVVRHTFDPALIEFAPADHGAFGDAESMREHIQATTPGPLEWDCFSFGIITRPGSFTVYAVVDHLHTDGVAQAVTFLDLFALYSGHAAGNEPVLVPVDGHIGYCERERARSAALTSHTPQVRRWLDLLVRNGGDLPSFPLPLGLTGQGFGRGGQLTIPLLTEPEALRFERICAEHGGRFLGGIFATIALTESLITGRDWYFGLTPASTRGTAGEAASVGWYTSLVPVAFDIAAGAGGSFTALVAGAQEAVDSAKELSDVSVHRVLQLVPPHMRIRTRPGWSAPMVSYLDARKIAGVSQFGAVNGGLYANRVSSSEVYMWVNRFPEATTATLFFPDTAEANESVRRYVATLTSVFDAITETGDFIAVVEALS